MYTVVQKRVIGHRESEPGQMFHKIVSLMPVNTPNV